MKFTLGWLKDHLETSATLDDIVAALTRTGLEVESVDNPAAKLAAFTIAKVVSASPHPNADKLRVCMVDIGAGALLQVVCGAPNARAGMTAVFAAPGAYVPGIDVTLKVSAIRGVESHGMMCSGRELELSDDHDGILDLPDDAPLGVNYATWAGLDDPVIDIAITPNRQDCLGIYGIARDLAVAGLGTLKTFDAPVIATNAPLALELRNEDPIGCPMLLVRAVHGVKNGQSPAWMQKRLRAIGMRPISTLVDITNYIMIDHGRSLHVYDLAKLDTALVVRRAKNGETLLALNDKTYTLDDSMTVLGDIHRADDIGGIMGGMGTGVSDTTTDVLIECAFFNPPNISLTGRKLGINSDARYRFERGVDPEFLESGLALATQMIIELCGGTPTEIKRAGNLQPWKKRVSYNPTRVATLGGFDIAIDKQKTVLAQLGFTVDSAQTPWTVDVPSWRRDVDGEADLVEDVLRITGYDTIAPQPLPRNAGVAKPTATPMQNRLKRVRNAAAARGFNEAITWSFIAPEQAQHFGAEPWTLENPISSEMAIMRQSLLPGLISAARRNHDRGAASVRLFEAGRRYLPDADGFERLTIALIASGEKSPRHWQSGKPSSFDVFDAKAEALALLDAAGAPVERMQVSADAPTWFHPGQSGTLKLDPRNPLAHFGVLHPTVVKALGLEQGAIAVELYLDAVPLPKSTKRARSKYAPPALQSVNRDFAFTVKDDVPAAKLITAIRGADKEHITDVQLFDRFAGKGIEPGYVSLAAQVSLQPKAQAFTAEQIDIIAEKIIAAAMKAIGAVLRT